jgi:glutathione peroxidase
MTTAHDFTFRTIDGEPLPMTKFKGNAVLVVNVASQCGLTPQYSGLEALWRAKRDKGLVILGVPANDFGAQEPGTESQIKTFCETRFGIDFPMTAKEHVIGGAAHPFYKWIVAQFGADAAPKWNFHKYLVGKDGTVVGTFGSRIEPNDATMNNAIDEALG